MIIVIPKLQKSLNILLRQHWAAFAKQQEVFDILLYQAYREKYSPPFLQNFRGKRVKITYTLYFPTKTIHDYSNYGQKMLDDSLVKAGIITDDSDRVIISETLRIRYDKDNPRTEIFIEEAE